MSKKTIVVVGAGQGLGNHVAERFAREDFRVVLLARRSEALAAYQKDFEAKGFQGSVQRCFRHTILPIQANETMRMNSTGFSD